MDMASVVNFSGAYKSRHGLGQCKLTVAAPEEVLKSALKDPGYRRTAECVFSHSPALRLVSLRLAAILLDVVPSSNGKRYPLFHKCLKQAIDDWMSLDHTPITLATEINQIPTFIGGLLRHVPEVMQSEVRVDHGGRPRKWNPLDIPLYDWALRHGDGSEIQVEHLAIPLDDRMVHLVRKCMASRVVGQSELIAIGGNLGRLMPHFDKT